MTSFLCFVHIEKCGGITLHNMLHRNSFTYISPDPSFESYFDASRLELINKMCLGQLSGIGGHKVGSFLNYHDVISEPIFYFSFVRNPIDRYLSHLNWQKHIMKIDWEVDEFINQPEFDNFQCYRLCGERNFEAAKKEVSDRFSFVGMLENYDESLLILSKMLKGKFNPHYELSNVKNYGHKLIKFDNLTENQKERVLLNNKEDMELYSYVKDELFPAYQSEFAIEDNDLVQFRSENFKTTFTSPVLFKRKFSNAILSRIVQPYADKKFPPSQSSDCN